MKMVSRMGSTIAGVCCAVLCFHRPHGRLSHQPFVSPYHLCRSHPSHSLPPPSSPPLSPVFSLFSLSLRSRYSNESSPSWSPLLTLSIRTTIWNIRRGSVCTRTGTVSSRQHTQREKGDHGRWRVQMQGKDENVERRQRERREHTLGLSCNHRTGDHPHRSITHSHTHALTYSFCLFFLFFFFFSVQYSLEWLRLDLRYCRIIRL